MQPPDSANDAALEQHLSCLVTDWNALVTAHRGEDAARRAAQQRLLQTYQRAVYRFLTALTRSPDAADDLFQEFAIRFLRGDFRNADPGRGRFRDFLKTALRRLVIDHQRREQRRAAPALAEGMDPADDTPPDAEADRQFLEAWQNELLRRAWDALLLHERQTGQRVHTVLRCRADHPDLSSEELASRLSAQLGQAVTRDWVRKWLMKARERFVDLLLEEVARPLDGPSLEELVQEVADLGLLESCKEGLQRRGWPA